MRINPNLDGDAALLREAHRGRHAGIGHRNNDVGVHWRFERQLPPHRVARLLHGTPENNAVGTREIDVLEDAIRLRLLSRIEARMHPFGPNDDQLARLHFALIGRSNEVEGAGLGGENDAVGCVRRLSRNPPHHQWTKAARVASGKDAVGRQHDQRKCAFDAAQRIGHRVSQGLLTGAGDQMHHDFSVAGGLKDGALLLQLGMDFVRVGDVAVVRQRNLALVAFHHDGLRVEQGRIAGGGVARVPDGQRARESREDVAGEEIGDQSHALVKFDPLTVRGGDARRLLAAMLQRVQAQVGELGGFRMAVDGHHATFFS